MQCIVEFDVYSNRKVKCIHVKMNFDSIKEAKEFVGNFKLNNLKISTVERIKNKKVVVV